MTVAIMSFAFVLAAQLTGNGVIAGKVVNAKSGAPLARATVTLQLEGPGDASAVVKSNAVGEYRFENLPAGRYRVSAVRTGFQLQFSGAKAPGLPGTALKIEDGGTLEAAAIRLVMNSSISGTISETDGEPAAAVDVALFRSINRRGGRDLQQYGNALTDDNGHYVLRSLQPGTYILIAGAAGSRTFSTNSAIAPVLVSTFYPGTRDEDKARPIEVRGGEQVTGIDVAVQRALSSRPKGRVILPEGVEADTMAQVLFRPLAGGFRGMMLGAGTNRQSGEVFIGALTPGKYQVSAIFESGGRKFYAIKEIELNPGEEKEFTLAPKPVFGLDCQVRIEGAGAAKFRELSIALNALPGRLETTPSATWKPGSPCRLNDLAEGTFEVSLNPVPEGLYVKSMTLGRMDVFNKEIALRESPADALSIVLSSEGAEVSGELEKDDTGASPQAVVLVAPQIFSDGPVPLHRIVKTDTEGKFRIRGLAPGAYRIYAFESLDLYSTPESERLQKFAPLAKELRLAEGGKSTVTLKVIPAN